MSSMPAQRPGLSRQDYSTPQDFLTTVKKRLGIDDFIFDYAAEATNAVCPSYWGPDLGIDSLAMNPFQWARETHSGWGWLNPPFSKIGPWARACRLAKQAGAQIAFLVPAAVGSNWFRDSVDGHAKVLLLNGRLAFMPDRPTWLYPKDCVLALYGEPPGYEVWTWKA